jgi:DNA polymerase III subunit delta
MARGGGVRDASAQLEKDLASGRFRPAYLLFGKEAYLVGEYRRRVEKAVLAGGVGGAFNREVLIAARSKPDQVTDAVRTMPMMGGQRLVVVEGVGEGDKKQANALTDAIAEVVKAAIPTAVLLLTAAAVDRRRKFFKAIAKHGLALECKPLWDRELKGWVGAEARRLGKGIDTDATHLLVDMVGNDLGKLHNELDKLSQYVGERPTITLTDAEEAVADLKLSTVFELTESLGERDLASALQALASLQETGAPWVRTLWFVTQHFRTLLVAREAHDGGADQETALLGAGVRKNVVWKIKRQLRVRSADELRRALVRIARADDDMRRSKVPAQLQLDRLVMDLCERR